MPKTLGEAGLEIADLVAHRAARQQRHELRGKDGRIKDFDQLTKLVIDEGGLSVVSHGAISKREAGWKTGRRAAMRGLAYSVSKPWLSNFRVRLFSVTVRTS